jgi:spermidine synthase
MKSYRILFLIFFLSGATGLVYEVIWVRLTGLVFGNTSHAIAVVLGAFMAGLALGSWWLGRKADRVQSALRLYGLLEIGIGLSAALVPLAFRSLNTVYWAAAPSLQNIPGGNGLVRFLTSFVVLLVPTFLMGGTLPVLARFFTQTVEEVQRKVGLLYALNTFGAAFGTLLAALIFIPQLGNTRTTLGIAALNLAIGIFAILLDSRVSRTTEPAAAESAEPAQASNVPADRTTDRLVLITLAASGFVSMLYEVAWTRALTAIIGSSTYAFSVMLVTFLVGIALGSSIASRRRATGGIRLLGWTQLGIAIGGFIFLLGYLGAQYVLVALMRALFYSFPAVLTSQFILCSLLMIFSTLWMGATLPIASQIYSNRFTLLGRSIGSIYSLNTLGAIAGSLTAGFVLLPLIGTERTILAGLFINSALALLLLSSPGATKGRDFAKWVALALLVVSTLSMRGKVFWDPAYMDRGILVYSRQFASRPELTINEQYDDTDVVYFKEGNNATISVRRGEDYLGLRTNGKVDASNQGDMITQLMIGYLPHLYHPNPKSTMIIGYGSGVTVGAATTFKEVEQIDCIEIEPAVVGAGPIFADYNRKSYENPKVKITFDDARTYLNTTRKQYDVIISEPSNPWIAGVASLFTAEFYDRAAQVLKPDGIFAQWVQLYELDPEDMRMILREVQAKFPEVSMWVAGSDLILIASRQPQHLNFGRWVQLAHDDPSVERDHRHYFKSTSPEGLLAYYVMSTEGVRTLATTRRRNTDDHPLLEFHAPRQLFQPTMELNVDLLYDAKDGLIPAGAEVPSLERAYGGMIEPFLKMDRSNLASQAMGSLSDLNNKQPGSLQLAMAEIDIQDSNLEEAGNELQEARKEMAPGSPLVGHREELWGLLSDRLGDTQEAIGHFRAAALADPHRPLPLQRLSEIYGHQQNWDEATQWMERYAETKPASLGHSWAMVGDYYLAAKEIDKAMKAFQTALHVDPYTFWARYRMARLYEEQNQTAQAIEQYELTMKYDFDREPELYLKLANLYKSQNRTKDAIAVLQRGLRIFPTNTPIYRLYREVRGED